MTLVNRLFETFMSNGSSNKPSLDGLLAQLDKELDNFQTLVPPAETSKPRTPFDSKNLTFNDMYMSKLTARQILSVLPVMLPLQIQMRLSAKMYDGQFQPKKSTADPGFIHQLETLAREAGAADIKYVRVPNNAIFKHKGIPYQYAVIFTVEMDRENMSTAPSFEAFREVAKG